MAKLAAIEGIGDVYAAQLEAAGVSSIEALLTRGGTPKGRRELAVKADIPQTLILDWVNRSDLFRIKGIGEEYSDLLEIAGVDTVPELAQRNPENLRTALADANRKRKVVRKLPSQRDVSSWVAQAKELPRVVTY